MMDISLLIELLQWLVIAVIVFLLGGVLYIQADNNRRLGPDLGAISPNIGLAVGTTAPDVTGIDIRTGRGVQLSSSIPRRTLITFLSPRCGPCGDLLPHLNRLADGESQVEMLVIVEGSSADAISFAKTLDRKIPVIADSDGTLGGTYGVQMTPLVYAIDEERRVLARTISNNLVELQDTLSGYGRPQGSAVFTPRPGAENGRSKDGIDDGPGTDPTSNKEI